MTVRDALHPLGPATAPDAARAASARWAARSPLAAKLTAALVGLVVLVLVVNGAINTWLGYQRAKSAALEVQQEKARSAAVRVGEFLADIETQLGWTTGAEWRFAKPDQQRYDFVRLLRQVPAITELGYLDGQGREQLKVSRLEPDAAGSGKDFSQDPRFVRAVADKIWFGPVEFRRGSEPYMTIALAHVGKQPGVTVADVNLKLIWDVISAIRVGEKGYAFVVDEKGRLIAHPDLSLVLRESDFSKLPQVSKALADSAPAEPGVGAMAPPRVGMAEFATGLDGGAVLTAYAVAPKTHWIVFTQQPLAEALATVYKSLLQTLALIGLGLVLALIVGGLLARRLVVPIRRLQLGAERLGAGDLSQRLDIRTGDEIETLAHRFNQMAGRIEESYATLEAKVEARTQDLNEALRLQTATSDVLKVISRSAFDLETVFTTLISSAVALCEAYRGSISVREGDVFRYRGGAGEGDGSTLDAYLAEHPAKPGLDSMVGRVLLSGKVEAIPDRLADREFAVPLEAHGYAARALLGVPLLGKAGVEGALVLTRKAPGRFSHRQIEIVQTFADQAVIAIENSRLLEQVQARTRELAASLDDLRKTQDRLVQTEKLASLGQLTAGIAHEIKNPLNFINNFAALSGELADELLEILASAPLDDKLREDVDEITKTLKDNLRKVVSHGKRADSIVKNMLSHSRSGSGEHRPTDVNAILEEALNLAYHGARAEKTGFNITLKRDLDPDAGMVDMFPQEISRAFLNLISNGFYAATRRKLDAGDPAFEPVLSASTKTLGDAVEIRVRDNGAGIPAEVRDKIFNPFFTTKPAGEGTGLGLSMTHDIVVKQHGGTIDVKSSPGEFTEFRIVLPRGGGAGDKPKG